MVLEESVSKLPFRNGALIGLLIGTGVLAEAGDFLSQKSPARQIHEALLNGDLERLEILQEEGVDIVGWRAHKEISALQFAAATGRGEVIRFLINLGAPLNERRGMRLNTALHSAVMTGRLESVKTLVEAGANLYSLNGDELTPVELAAEVLREAITGKFTSQAIVKGSENDYRQIFRFLWDVTAKGRSHL